MNTMSPSLTLGPFQVARDGLLALREAEVTPALRFAWRGRSMEATLTGETLRLRAVAAHIPFTAQRPEDRSRAFGTVRNLPPSLPEGWELTLAPDHSIVLETRRLVGGVTTASQLMAALARFALDIDPYLDKLEAGGAVGPGTEKT